MVQFDTTVSIGNIATILAVIGGSLAAFFRVKGKLDVIAASNEMQSTIIDELRKEISQLREVLVTMGRFEERLIALQREVTELRHGKGFIANGEYGRT